MNKFGFTIIAILLLNFAPLLGRPELMLHPKSLILALAAACLWLSQPAFSTQETKRDQGSDRLSIVVILMMSSISVICTVSEWGYLNNAVESSLMWSMVGVCLLFSGIAIRVWAIQTLGKHFTATVTLTRDHCLVKSGPYHWVRHPSYLGAFMAITGAPLFLNAWWAVLVSVICMSIAYFLRITVEENMLSSYFGEQYIDYTKTTKRIIPFIW